MFYMGGNLVFHTEEERKLRVYGKRLLRKEFWEMKGRGNRGLKETAQ
jgi:hypothetical protein